MWKQPAAIGVLIGLILVACRSDTPPEILAAGPPPAASAIHGTFVPPDSHTTLSGRWVTLCRVSDGAATLPADCVLIGPVATTDPQGRFAFDDIAPGMYLVLYDSGLSDFDAATRQRAGETIRIGDWGWTRDGLLALPAGASASVRLPQSFPPGLSVDYATYGLHTLLFDGSPFVVAHEIRRENGWAVAAPLFVDARAGEAAAVIMPMFTPASVDYAVLRERIGPLTRDEVLLLDRDLVARWQRFLAGDDTAYQDTDVRVIEALRSGTAYEIGNASLAAVEEYDGALIKRVGYVTVDVRTGERRVIGWLDEATGDVIEARTGYHLNVRDDPGVWIEAGPDGEQFYHYGFSYYRRWEQILPDPIIALVDDFYTEGVAHFWRHVADYQAAAAAFGGDMLLVTWDNRMLEQIAAWRPTVPPFVHLPDSGTVDIRRERFLAALINRNVVIDEDSLQTFLASDVVRNGTFNRTPDPQEVRDALLIPYRSGHLFSDLEAAIILDATYSGDGPLTIRISPELQQGFLVPEGNRNEILVAQDEVANVLLGYPGALNSRWAHEMGHIVDFRAEQYTFRGAPSGGSRCEPVKYLMEYMWWVRRYPGDAPDWDWLPINSGLTLARLLVERFHNSGC